MHGHVPRDSLSSENDSYLQSIARILAIKTQIDFFDMEGSACRDTFNSSESVAKLHVHSLSQGYSPEVLALGPLTTWNLLRMVSRRLKNRSIQTCSLSQDSIVRRIHF